MKNFVPFLAILTMVTASWVTLSHSATPVNSYTTQAHPPSSKGSLWCVEDGLYWLSAQQMWKFEYHSKRWLWMVDPPSFGVVKAHWNLGNVLYVLTDRLWRYDHQTRAWQPQTSQNAAPSVQGQAVFWSDLETESLFLYTAQDFTKFELVGNNWVTIMAFSGNRPTYFVGSQALIYTDNELRQWDHGQGWIVVNMQEALPKMVQLWRTAQSTAYSLTTLGDMWRIDLKTGQSQSIGTQGFVNRANFSACSDQMVVLGGAPNFNDVMQFGPAYKSLLDFGPVLIISGATLATSALCFIILVTLCVVICYQQCRKKKTQLGPFVSGPHNVDFL